MALVEADRDLSSDPSNQTLARAFLLTGSKDSHAVRSDEASAFRVSAERIRGVVVKRVNAATPSDAGLATGLASALRNLHLPPEFSQEHDHQCHRRTPSLSLAQRAISW